MLLSLPLNKVAVSACLTGSKCRYDGRCSRNIEQFKGCTSICPEILGGLPVPRIPCQIDKGDGFDVLAGLAKVIGSDGVDYTEEFIAGAKEALKICLENRIAAVILKEKSPSCGVGSIYNDDELVIGCGVTAALLKQNGIDVISDREVIDE